jgi:serine phosphatase RsbU (regulator of sigma subunit)
MLVIIAPPFWKRWWFILLCVGAIVCLLRAIILFREKQLVREKELLEDKVELRTKQLNEEKKLVEEKNIALETYAKNIEHKSGEILQNITHAQKIQQAILPQDRLVSEWLNNSFVLYRPKDIVSGDFYFMDSRNNNVYFAAVDCTGHGVSGAFVSIIGHTGLKRTIDEFKLSHPSDMLQKLNELVVETLKQESGSESLPDGMDIALCRLNILKNELLFAGAKRPLWLIRNGELQEFDGSRKSIGGMKYEEDRNKVFEQHKIQLQKNDVFYIFTDGIVDQFGTTGKKLMSKRFREFLLSIHHLEMPDQRLRLNTFIDEWRGREEQTDDVCVIGVRV